jgi:P pilus assembly chaperone PapD
MGKASFAFKEVRFIYEEELTQVYVALEAYGDCPLNVQGWHHKTFPASKNSVDILNTFGSDSPVMWAQEAPESAA